MPLHCWIKLTLTVPFPPVVELGTQQSLGRWQKWRGERNVRFQRRNAQKKTSIVLNGSSKRGT